MIISRFLCVDTCSDVWFQDDKEINDVMKLSNSNLGHFELVVDHQTHHKSPSLRSERKIETLNRKILRSGSRFRL